MGATITNIPMATITNIPMATITNIPMVTITNIPMAIILSQIMLNHTMATIESLIMDIMQIPTKGIMDVMRVRYVKITDQSLVVLNNHIMKALTTSPITHHHMPHNQNLII